MPGMAITQPLLPHPIVYWLNKFPSIYYLMKILRRRVYLKYIHNALTYIKSLGDCGKYYYYIEAIVRNVTHISKHTHTYIQNIYIVVAHSSLSTAPHIASYIYYVFIYITMSMFVLLKHSNFTRTFCTLHAAHIPAIAPNCLFFSIRFFFFFICKSIWYIWAP